MPVDAFFLGRWRRGELIGEVALDGRAKIQVEVAAYCMLATLTFPADLWRQASTV